MNASALQYLPLDQLTRSPKNARKTGGGNIADLAASITAIGLLQNLTVERVADDRFEVVAGDRRLRALWHMRDAGTLPEELQTVPCLIAVNGSISEVSAAENMIREAMHPADQFDAFARMVKDKKPIEDIAAHFGVSEVVVKQRLRLANVSPKLLEGFRRGEMTLAQVIALSISDDHAHQEKVWAAARGEWQREPARLREAIVGKKLAADKGVGAFVGIKDYEAHGGAVVRDLFGEEAYLADPGLVERLALEKLQKRADMLKADGWSWVEARIEFGWDARQKFRQVDGQYKDGKRVYSAEFKAAAGAVVYVDGNTGRAMTDLGLVKPGQKVPSAKKEAAKAAKRGSAADAQPETRGLSQGQQQLLAGYRTAVARHELASNPRAMLAVLAADLACRYLEEAPDAANVVMFNRDMRADGMQEFRQGLEEADITKDLEAALAKRSAALRKAVGRQELLPWLLQQPEAVTHELLAAVAAASLNLSLGEGDALCGMVGIDFAPFWQVSEAWLAELQKGTILAIVREVHGNAHEAELKALKRPDAAKRAAELLAGTGWLPEPLRGPGYKPRKGDDKGSPTTSRTSPKPAATKMAAKARKKNPVKRAAKKAAKTPKRKGAPMTPASAG